MEREKQLNNGLLSFEAFAHQKHYSLSDPDECNDCDFEYTCYLIENADKLNELLSERNKNNESNQK